VPQEGVRERPEADRVPSTRLTVSTAQPLHAYDKTIDLFIDLGANEEDLFFPHLYTFRRGRICSS